MYKGEQREIEMTTTIEQMTTEEIDALAASIPVQFTCPTCKGKSQESDDAPHCGTCKDYGWFPNPEHPYNR